MTSNQLTAHEDIAKIVNKYLHSEYRRPIAEHTQLAFEQAIAWLGGWQGEVVIDACCGVGESTAVLAGRYPHAKVLGVDKSSARLGKHDHYSLEQNNYRVFQADLHDFWRLLLDYLQAHQASGCFTVIKQYLLYPNPYPKKSQVQKRWHASPTLLPMMAVCRNIEVRSNWQIYLQEFAQALQVLGINSSLEVLSSEPMTPFERKYMGTAQTCWRLYTDADGVEK